MLNTYHSDNQKISLKSCLSLVQNLFRNIISTSLCVTCIYPLLYEANLPVDITTKLCPRLLKLDVLHCITVLKAIHLYQYFRECSPFYLVFLSAKHQVLATLQSCLFVFAVICEWTAEFRILCNFPSLNIKPHISKLRRVHHS